ITPFASVAMLEKLALLKIARCRAPALSSASSACWREITSQAPSETPIRVLVTSFPLAMVLLLPCPYRIGVWVTHHFNATTAMRGLPSIFLCFPPTARAVGLSVEDNGCRRWLKRDRDNGVAGAFAVATVTIPVPVPVPVPVAAEAATKQRF